LVLAPGGAGCFSGCHALFALVAVKVSALGRAFASDVGDASGHHAQHTLSVQGVAVVVDVYRRDHLIVGYYFAAM
jgi:hypothetical protein